MAAVLLPVAFSTAPPDTKTCTYHYHQGAAKLNGRMVAVEYYVPDGATPHSLVFMLHGSAGAFTLRSAEEPAHDNFGEKALARSCFTVVLPHYLEGFGLKSMTSTDEMASMFPELLAAADTLLTDAESHTPTKGQPVFLFGESLGGYLSVALALRRREVRAVSEISGGLAEGYAVEKPHQVAMLISHGVNDPLVPVGRAEELKQYCSLHGMEVDAKLYLDVEHYFPPSVEADCIGRTIQFFLAHVHKG